MDTWQKLSGLVEERLKAASSGERAVFTAGVAERLMSRHEALPKDEQAPFTVSLRPLLNSVWEGVLSDSTAFSAVKRGVGEYLLSEYCHNDGQDGPDNADESAAASTLYAAHAHLFGCQEFAVWTSSRAVEAIDQHLECLADEEGGTARRQGRSERLGTAAVTTGSGPHRTLLKGSPPLQPGPVDRHLHPTPRRAACSPFRPRVNAPEGTEAN